MPLCPSAPRPAASALLAVSRAYRCRCGRPIFFRNSECLACRAPLGYLPSSGTLCCLRAGSLPGTWQVSGPELGPGRGYRRCTNFTRIGCNWLIEDGDDEQRPALCVACRLNRTIPSLASEANLVLWRRMEKAKRRLISQLIGLGLDVSPRGPDRDHGLAYDFLSSGPGEPRVITGHCGGIITIDIAEADDPFRERVREDMGEPYRTLLGHFRHEIGHYYWDRLVAGTRWQAPFRAAFGDERQDYGAALKANYERGPPADWNRHFVSAYASMHPWEDWAETFAHYLHIRDTLDTAVSFRLATDEAEVEAQPYGSEDLWDRHAAGGTAFLQGLHAWIGITSVMNEMSSAMGLHDFYPFVLPRAAVAKLHFIHCLVSQCGDGAPG
ncbi:zinc-binding metallopeptidase family protein [Eleftheria terrae]|uniref:zinc-binding metallopeptidase family protein n=1 Tax=Eleftheria terrae TaxID=1597781 RepID=UPI00263A830B|nr:putative zinc-binding metallopeptidase [Eleftheria terrae]WKB55852.1 putative zinc-binding peptidase [Eleftheria terrae]